MVPRRSSTFGRNSKELTDPYSLLLEGRLDSLRPDLDSLTFQDPYTTEPLQSKDNFLSLRKEFEDGQSLQLISQRSRPGAYAANDPNSSGPGVVDIKVVKAGFLFKLEGKRKSVWREWGIILTASQLYFFKDTIWFRNNIMNQQSASSLSRGRSSTTPTPTDLSNEPSEEEDPEIPPAIIRPMVDGFHPHAVVPTTDMVALFSTFDTPARQHSFMLGHKGGATDWFSSQDEPDLLDWMLKINFAASFNTFYVVGVYSSIIRRPHRKLKSLRRNNSDSSMTTIFSESTSTTSRSERATAQLAQEFSDIHFARKFNVELKLGDIKKKLAEIERQIDEYIRHGRGLKLLAPIQPRTREAVFLSAAKLTAALRWKWLERRRLICYEEYFETDLKVEQEICSTLKPQVRPGSSLSARVSSGYDDDDDDDDNGDAEHASLEILDPLAEAQDDDTEHRTSLVAPQEDSGHKRNVSEVSTHTITLQHSNPSDSSVKESDVNSVSESVPSVPSVESRVSDEETEESKATPLLVPKRPKSQGQLHMRSLSQSVSQTAIGGKKVVHLRSKSQSVVGKSSTSLGSSGGSSEMTMGSPSKRMPLTLRGPSLKRKGKGLSSSSGKGNGGGAQRSASLIRKEGENITLYGKRFHVVNVNPEFAVNSNHQRSLSQNIGGSSVADGLSLTSLTDREKDAISVVSSTVSVSVGEGSMEEGTTSVKEKASIASLNKRDAAKDLEVGLSLEKEDESLKEDEKDE